VTAIIGIMSRMIDPALNERMNCVAMYQSFVEPRIVIRPIVTIANAIIVICRRRSMLTEDGMPSERIRVRFVIAVMENVNAETG